MSLIRLRALEPEDAGLLYSIENDEAAWSDSDTMAPYSLHTLQQYALTPSDPARDRQLRLVVCSAADSTPLGLLDFYDIDFRAGCAFLAIYIRKEFRSMGYGLKTILEGMDYGRKFLNIDNFGAKILNGNEESKKLFEKAGFRKVGVLWGWHFANGSLEDIGIWQYL